MSAERLDENVGIPTLLKRRPPIGKLLFQRVTWPAVSSEMGFAAKSMMSLCSKEYVVLTGCQS